MHKNATKCNETLSKWYKNKHGTSKIIDTFETYHAAEVGFFARFFLLLFFLVFWFYYFLLVFCFLFFFYSFYFLQF
jgi:hypothetical protein